MADSLQKREKSSAGGADLASGTSAAAASASRGLTNATKPKSLWRVLLTRTRHVPPIVVGVLIFTGLMAFWEGLRVMAQINPTEAMVQFVVGHFFFILFTWSWLAAAFTNPAVLPDHEDHPELHYCLKCYRVKPDRTHHCSWCDCCVQRFDHHCPWVGGCVGQHNHKAFMLFLFWLVVGGAYGAARMCFLINDPVYDGTGVQMLFMLCCVLVLVVGPFAGFHGMLVVRNLTSLEYVGSFTSTKSHLRYHEGYYNNICSVMGPDPLLWFFPLLPKPEPDTSRFRPLDEEELHKPWFLQLVEA